MLLLRVQLSILAVCLFSCCSTYRVNDMQYNSITIADSLSIDSSLYYLISGYKEKLQAEMNKKLVFNKSDMFKSQPESELGNFMADVCKQRAEQEIGKTIDLAVLNYGGIRLSSISKGWVTKSKMYELMPFDNNIVVLEISGDTLELLFDQIANYGGWPLSGATFIIKNNSADNILIGDQLLDKDKSYLFATSDYLANGGDRMDILKQLEQIQTGVLLRDALIDYCDDVNSKGDSLHFEKNNRIIKE